MFTFQRFVLGKGTKPFRLGQLLPPVGLHAPTDGKGEHGVCANAGQASIDNRKYLRRFLTGSPPY